MKTKVNEYVNLYITADTSSTDNITMGKKNREKGSKLRKYTLENFKMAVQAVR